MLGQPRPLLQIGYILSELGIERIYAHSPQAKGRIERAFQTLQERLLVELRLAGASCADEANAVLKEFIPRYNERFAVPPAEPEPAFRPIPPHTRLEHIFCRKEHRKLNPGYTIHYGGQNYRLVITKSTSMPPLRSVVDVLDHPDGSIYVAYKGQINSVELRPEAETLRNKNKAKTTSSMPKERVSSSSPRKPGPNHPWRKRAVVPKASRAKKGTLTNTGLTALASGRSQVLNYYNGDIFTDQF